MLVLLSTESGLSDESFNPLVSSFVLLPTLPVSQS